MLDLRGNIPTFVEITEAKLHDVNILDAITLEAGSIYVMDRAYLDFERLLRDASTWLLFCHARQNQYQNASPLLASK